jgi:hypothetical protein
LVEVETDEGKLVTLEASDNVEKKHLIMWKRIH